MRNGTKLRWRYEYAQLLLDQKKFDDALRQAIYLVRARPKSSQYKRLHAKANSQSLRQGAPR